MGLGDWIASTFAKSSTDIVTSLADVADRFIQTKEEKAEFKLEMIKAQQEIQKLTMEAEKLYFEDRQSARQMQIQTKSKVPGILTMVFTVAYFLVTSFMLFFLLGKLEVELSQFVTVFISTIFGAFNAIMVQIVSFYFGSSNGGEEQGSKMADAFNNAAQK